MGFRGSAISIVFLFLFMAYQSVAAEVVINEIHYNPSDIAFDPNSAQEFIELYNPGSEPVDLSGYAFTQGISYTFPENTIIGAESFAILAKNPNYITWRRASYPRLGPYEGYLADDGERLTLAKPDGTVVDTVRYSDFTPWPRRPDGYGVSLERISWDLPSEDYHSWRSSLRDGGTPYAPNSVLGTPPNPIIRSYEINPQHPTSDDEVTVRVSLDVPDKVESVSLQWENAKQSSDGQPMNILVNGYDSWRYFKGQAEPSGGTTDWTELNFDDSAWLQGEGGIGYGEPDFIQTNLSDMRSNYTTVYIRREFDVSDPAQLGILTMVLFIDDGYVCYINGNEVARGNAPSNYTFRSTATDNHEASDPYIVELGEAADFLLPGKNVIAFVGFNITLSGSSDFVLLPYLFELPKSQAGGGQIAMSRTAEASDLAIYEATIPPAPSQSLIRWNLRVQLESGETVLLPHQGEIRPFESYFVYDGETASLLPVMWVFHAAQTSLTEISRNMTGVVTKMPDEEHPQVFDGTLVYPSRNGHKIRFLKGEEFRGDRTVNLIPERPTGGTTAGASSPFREDLGFWFFGTMGVPVPRADWFRVIHTPNIERGEQTQQLVIQQVNERFLEMNGLNPDADLYKRNYVNPLWEKHTNKEEGIASMSNLMSQLQQPTAQRRREALENNLNVEEFFNYIVTSVLLSNWDGFHNNHWMYYDPDTPNSWTMIPWDLDKVFGYTDTNPMFVRMPPTFPRDGRAEFASREAGPITGQFVRDEEYNAEYIRRLRYELDNTFTQERLFTQFEDVEQLLLADLRLLEEQIGHTRRDRRDQITESIDILKTFVNLRKDFLNSVLPASVTDWPLFQ